MNNPLKDIRPEDRWQEPLYTRSQLIQFGEEVKKACAESALVKKFYSMIEVRKGKVLKEYNGDIYQVSEDSILSIDVTKFLK